MLGEHSDIQPSALRIIMCLNQVDPNDSSTSFVGSIGLRYPLEFVPQIQRASPDGVVVAHFHIPRAVVDNLEEDRNLLRQGA